MPEPRLTRLVSQGFAPVVADWYWVQVLQLVGGAVNDVGNHADTIADSIDLITSLDPWVDHPYRFAAIWLTAEEQQVRRANRLLEKSLSYHPRDWRNRFYLGYNQFFYLQEHANAARTLEGALHLPGAPNYLGPLVTRLRADSGDLETAELFLQELIRTAPDEYARAEYWKAHDEIETERRARILDRARAVFIAAQRPRRARAGRAVAGAAARAARDAARASALRGLRLEARSRERRDRLDLLRQSLPPALPSGRRQAPRALARGRRRERARTPGSTRDEGRRSRLRVEGIVKDFRPGFGLRVRRVLHGLSFQVGRGEIFGFVGPNGAGKTTTLKVLMGLVRPTSGRASILGIDVGSTESRRHVGFLPENPYFYELLSGRELLHFYARLSGVSRASRARRVDTLLDWVGLRDAADARLRTYSKGMQQRIGIAQALIHDPQVIFLDEPMSGLDPIGRKEIRDLILRLRGEGKTVFMNTHILSDVELLCDRVAILVAGRIRYEGAPHELLEGTERETEVVAARVGADTVVALEERCAARLRGHGDKVEIRVPEKSVQELLSLLLASGADVLSVTPQRRVARADLPLGGGGQALMSAQVVTALAHNTLLESVRNKIAYALLFFALLMIGSGAIVSSLSYAESGRILQDVGLAAIRLFGVAIAIFVGIQLVHREVERRTVYTILSKPISRAQFLLGKFAGLTLTIWLQMACMGAAFVAVSAAAGAPLAWHHLAFGLLVAAELAVVVALATLFSTFTTPMLAAFFTTGIWAVGQLTRELRDIGAASSVPGLKETTALLFRVLPDFHSFDLATEAAHQLPLTASDVLLPLAYGFGYTTLVLLLAVAIFERRDLR